MFLLLLIGDKQEWKNDVMEWIVLQSDDILLQNLYILFSEMTQSRKLRIHLQVIGYGDDS